MAAPHDRLGIHSGLEGTHVDQLLPAMEAADGRTAWAIEAVEVRPGLTVRSVVLSADRPARGATGSVVRLVRVTEPGGTFLLVAEDRFYDRPDGVAVTL
ncbi:MAG: hypothetical protein ACKO04_07455 [Actinomycetes bacterium]